MKESSSIWIFYELYFHFLTIIPHYHSLQAKNLEESYENNYH